jgi:ATP-dependent Clp protease ATP-binding subunit ClpB
VDVSDLRRALETHLSKQPKIQSNAGGQKVMGRDLPKVLEAARTIQSMLGDSFVSTEGLLLALIKEDTQFTRAAVQNQEIKYQDALDIVKKMREKSGPTISRSAENMYDALLKYGIDFTERAEEGKLE